MKRRARLLPSVEVNSLCDVVIAARVGDVTAYGRLVQETQAISFAVAVEILRDAATAEDAVQQAYFARFPPPPAYSILKQSGSN